MLFLKNTITVFSITSCPHCLHTKSVLSSLLVPFTEINIEKHPSHRPKMIALSNKMSVPQVFFGNRLIGGNDDFQSLLHNAGLMNSSSRDNSLIVSPDDPAILSFFDSNLSTDESLDERLAAPTTPPVTTVPLPTLDDTNTLPAPPLQSPKTHYSLNTDVTFVGESNINPVPLTHSLKKLVDKVCSEAASR